MTPERTEAEWLNKIERLLRKAERDARLLDGRDFKMRPWAEAYRLLDLLREREKHETEALREIANPERHPADLRGSPDLAVWMNAVAGSALGEALRAGSEKTPD